MVYYFDMDGVLCNFHKEPYKYENAINTEWIANLDPFPHNVAIARNLITQGATVYILTMAASESAREGKVKWLARYMPEIDSQHFICIIKQGKKVDHMQEPGVLIDDCKKNTIPWEKAGYPAILLRYKGEPVEL